MSEYCYKPSGELQGDDRPIPNRGTGTGMTGHANQLDGAAITQDAENRIVGIKGSTHSDAMERDMPLPPASA